MDEEPLQTDDGEVDAEVGAIELVFNVRVTGVLEELGHKTAVHEITTCPFPVLPEVPE